ncbi:hypothetical protein AHF37_02907 [Paragonimus kellicotti]|nr:hypothetical protein AHF37_02907 [Paragonimus kellicotti]
MRVTAVLVGICEVDLLLVEYHLRSMGWSPEERAKSRSNSGYRFGRSSLAAHHRSLSVSPAIHSDPEPNVNWWRSTVDDDFNEWNTCPEGYDYVDAERTRALLMGDERAQNLQVQRELLLRRRCRASPEEVRKIDKKLRRLDACFRREDRRRRSTDDLVFGTRRACGRRAAVDLSVVQDTASEDSEDIWDADYPKVVPPLCCRATSFVFKILSISQCSFFAICCTGVTSQFK